MQQRICTKEEIEQLHLFCKKHLVKYADVHEELVDHLASAIEEQWETDKNIHFKDALQNCYKQFGVMGFHKIVSEKKEAVRKYHINLQKKYLFHFIKVPQIFATILIAVALFYAIPYNPYLFNWCIGGFIAIALVFIFTMMNYYSKRWEKIFTNSTTLILKDVHFLFLLSAFLTFMMLTFINTLDKTVTIPLWQKILVTFSVLINSISILFVFYFLPKHAEEMVIKQYPQLVK